MRRDVDVCVVGGGVAGLIAARDCQRAGHSVVVLEARDRVGGRTVAEPFGKTMGDTGGQWIGARHRRLTELAKEFGLETFEQYSAGKKILCLDGERSEYTGLLPWIGLRGALSAAVGGSRLVRRIYQARNGSLTLPGAASLDGQSAAAWIQKRVRSRKARALLDIVCECIFGAEATEYSFLFLLHYLSSGGGLFHMAQSRGGVQHARIVGGMQQVSERLAEELTVEFSQPVTAIRQDAGGLTVEANGTVRARAAIVSVPPALWPRIRFEPALPERKQQMDRAMPHGSVVKCLVGYDRAFWREAGYCGEAAIYPGPVRATFDITNEPHDQPALLAFVVGKEADRLGALSVAERQEIVTDTLAELFGPEAKSPSVYLDKNWNEDEWSAGCYTGLLVPGATRRHLGALAQPHDRVSFAGTETASECPGYIEGAIESGERAAQEVLRRLSTESRREYAARQAQ